MARKPPSCTLQELIDAGSIEIKIGPTFNEEVRPRQFSNGTYGFYVSGKVELPLPNGNVAVMLGSTILTVIPSKGAYEQS